jgi:hypothetical protein
MQLTTALKSTTPTRHPYREQRKPRLLDHCDKQEALPGIRSMLADPTLCYQAIGQHLGVTRQKIAQIAAKMGVDGRRRQHERHLRIAAAVFQQEPDYPPNIREAERRLLVNGVLCRIYTRRGATVTGRTASVCSVLRRQTDQGGESIPVCLGRS